MSTYIGWPGITGNFPRMNKQLRSVTLATPPSPGIATIQVGGRGSIFQPPRPLVGQLFPRGAVKQ